jgi:phosphoribosyl-AMP cyclohydrolase
MLVTAQPAHRLNEAAHPVGDVNNGPVTYEPEPGADGELDPEIAALLKRDQAGLVAAVVQEQTTGEVLMVGWMDDAALHRTLTTGRSTFYSRSRQEYWVKGETSGHRQWVREVRLDCDGDTLLVQVQQDGPACHTGSRTCFDDRVLPARVRQPQTELSGPRSGT